MVIMKVMPRAGQRSHTGGNLLRKATTIAGGVGQVGRAAVWGLEMATRSLGSLPTRKLVQMTVEVGLAPMASRGRWAM